MIKSESNPRRSSLDIIARYLGFENLEKADYVKHFKSSEIYKCMPYLDTRDLPEGAVLVVKWNPRRTVYFRHLGNGKYIVVQSNNSKLHEGDIVSMTFLAHHYPLIATSLIRDNKNLGTYIGAPDEGIVCLRIRQ